MIPTFQLGQFGRAQGASAFVGPLDSYTTNLWSAMSLSRLLTAYAGGPLESYDTTAATTHNALFSSSGVLDSSELVTWGGSHTQTLKTFINQEGTTNRGFDGAGSTARYPTLVNAGAYLGFAEFDASSDYLSSGTTVTPSAVTIFLRGKIRTPTFASRQHILEHTVNPQTNGGFFVWYDNSSDGLRVGNYKASPAGYAVSHFNGAYPNDDVHCYRIDRAQVTSAAQNVFFLNGTKQTRTGSFDTGTLPSGAMPSGGVYLAARQAAGNPATLNVHTLIIYTAALSDADCTAISSIVAALP